MDKSPYTMTDQASNGLPLSPIDDRRESNFRRIDRAARTSTVPTHAEAERQETPGYPTVRWRSEPGDDQEARAEPPRAHEQSERPSSAGSKAWWQAETLTVADVMTTNPKTVRPDASIREIADLMRQEDVGVVPVVEEDGRLQGVVTDRDIVVRGLVSGRSIETSRARDVATTNLEVASVHDSLSDVIELMGRERIRRVPVLDQHDKLVGILAMADIANRADYREDLQHAFQKISARRSFWSRMWR